jgi:tetratricopeptide (TPR) repeat protein
VLGKAEGENGKLKVEQVEKLVESEMKHRQEALKSRIKDAKEKAKSGDKDAALPVLRAALEQKCMFPGEAKEAAKELKKLGVTDIAAIPDSPQFCACGDSKDRKEMSRGLAAEDAFDYLKAERYYAAAHKLDAADPTPLRYLGEMYRHHIGDWQRARGVFTPNSCHAG